MPQLPAIYAVRLCTTQNVDLATGGLLVVDGIQSAVNDEVLVPRQMNSADNGIYRVQEGGWVRHEDWDEDADFSPGRFVYIISGTDERGSTWKFENEQAPTLGAYNLNFAKGERRLAPFGVDDEGIVVDPDGGLRVANLTEEDPGKFSPVGGLVDKKGRILTPSTVEYTSGDLYGLGFGYVDAHNVQINPGAAFIPARKGIVALGSVKTVPIPATPDGYFDLYLYEENREGQIWVDPDVRPGTPYFGTAQTKSDDSSMRYLGFVRNDSSGNVIPFEDTVLGGETVFRMYGDPQYFATNVVSGGNTVRELDIGPEAINAKDRLVSAVTRTVYVHTVAQFVGTNGSATIGWRPGGIFPQIEASRVGSSYRYNGVVWCHVSPSQVFRYRVLDTDASFMFGLFGFYERR